jgi:hypothetical protein
MFRQNTVHGHSLVESENEKTAAGTFQLIQNAHRCQLL